MKTLAAATTTASHRAGGGTGGGITAAGGGNEFDLSPGTVDDDAAADDYSTAMPFVLREQNGGDAAEELNKWRSQRSHHHTMGHFF